MKYLYSVLLFTVVCSSNCAKEFDLKIEYNEAYDKQTTQDKLDIAFVNKANSVETEFVNIAVSDEKLRDKDDLYYHKPDWSTYLKNAHGFDENQVKIITDNDITNFEAIYKNNEEIIPFLSLGNIKDKLKTYIITKRYSHYVTPVFNYLDSKLRIADDDFKNYLEKTSDGNNLDVLTGKYKNVTNHNIHNPNTDALYRNNMFADVVDSEGNTADVSHPNAQVIHNNNNLKEIKQIIEAIEKQRKYKDFLSILKRPVVLDILREQNDLIHKLEKHLRSVETKAMVSEFDKLLQSVAMRRNNTTTVHVEPERITAEEDTTTTHAPLKTMIDETAIREALKSDPYVQRILKMANQKKSEYMKNVRTYYGDLL